eukprot:scaffold578_cov243-Pinguiococcus_pyrenoidosus.AAC.14
MEAALRGAQASKAPFPSSTAAPSMEDPLEAPSKGKKRFTHAKGLGLRNGAAEMRQCNPKWLQDDDGNSGRPHLFSKLPTTSAEEGGKHGQLVREHPITQVGSFGRPSRLAGNRLPTPRKAEKLPSGRIAACWPRKRDSRQAGLTTSKGGALQGGPVRWLPSTMLVLARPGSSQRTGCTLLRLAWLDLAS